MLNIKLKYCVLKLSNIVLSIIILSNIVGCTCVNSDDINKVQSNAYNGEIPPKDSVPVQYLNALAKAEVYSQHMYNEQTKNLRHTDK